MIEYYFECLYNMQEVFYDMIITIMTVWCCVRWSLCHKVFT